MSEKPTVTIPDLHHVEIQTTIHVPIGDREICVTTTSEYDQVNREVLPSTSAQPTSKGLYRPAPQTVPIWNASTFTSTRTTPSAVAARSVSRSCSWR